MTIQAAKEELGAQHVEIPRDADGEKAIEETRLDPEAEKELVRKCDIRVLPPITVLFFLAFMDRTNIGEYCRFFSVVHVFVWITNFIRQRKNSRNDSRPPYERPRL